VNLRRARGTRVFPRLDLGGSSQSADGSRLEAWDPSTSHDSSHGETRVGRAGLRIEGKNDDTDVNLQGLAANGRAHEAESRLLGFGNRRVRTRRGGGYADARARARSKLPARIERKLETSGRASGTRGRVPSGARARLISQTVVASRGSNLFSESRQSARATARVTSLGAEPEIAQQCRLLIVLLFRRATYNDYERPRTRLD